jgi:hypothetical protein
MIRGAIMDLQAVYNIGLGTIVAGMGWFARELWGAVAELRRDVKQIEIDLPSNYLRKDEFREGINEIKSMLNDMGRKIDDLRDRKADK